MRGLIAAMALLTAVALAACEDDPAASAFAEVTCPPGQRRVVFRLDGAADVVRCVEPDTLLASPTPACTLVSWTAPANGRHDEGFRYEASAADTASPCGTAFFFAVTQNSVGGYTYYDGLVQRAFDGGGGPFATGVYEVLNGQQTLVAIGHFEFWE